MPIPFKFKPSLAAIACVFALSACASGGGSPSIEPTLTTSEKLDRAVIGYKRQGI